jgi:ClpP class serine protease
MTYDFLLNIVNSTWLCEQNTMSRLLGVFDAKLNGNLSELNALMAEPMNEWSKKSFAYETKENVAYFKVSGTIVPRTGSMQPHCGMFPVYALEQVLSEAEANPRLDTCIIHFDSGGGIGIGVPEMADRIRSSRLKTIGFTDTYSCSASYWLMSACSEVVMAPSARVGSIGAYVGVTKKVPTDKDSYKTHIFSAGENKLFGSPDVAMSENEANYLQKMVTDSYNSFVTAVAKYRGVTEQQVIDTKAGVFNGTEASFLVDKVITLNQLLWGD